MTIEVLTALSPGSAYIKNAQLKVFALLLHQI